MNGTQKDLNDLDFSPNWANRNPDRCLCKGSGWITSNYDTQHNCAWHADRSGNGPSEPNFNSPEFANDDEDDSQYWDAMDAHSEVEAEYEANRRQDLYRACAAYYRAFCIENGMSADAFDLAMSDECSEAADGSPRSAANAAQSIAGPVLQEAQEAAAREQGHSCYSEMLYADAYRAEQFEENGRW